MTTYVPHALIVVSDEDDEDLSVGRESRIEELARKMMEKVDEEMKTPMQRANEDRVARERLRIKDSLERRMKKLPPGQSAKINQLAGELKDLTDKELPAEVAKLTEKLDEVVKRINKG